MVHKIEFAYILRAFIRRMPPYLFEATKRCALRLSKTIVPLAAAPPVAARGKRPCGVWDGGPEI